MAMSTLPPVAASNPRFPPLPNKRNTTFLKTQLACAGNRTSDDASCSPQPYTDTRRRLLQAGLVLLATPLVALEANATRVEYYATVAEPVCDLSFAKSGLGYCDVVVGNGVEPPRGQLINIHYTARFADGTVFDSSYKRGRPLTLRIGVGKVLPGLDQGIFGGGGIPPMFAGGKRKLQIPPELAYGPEPAGCFSGDQGRLEVRAIGCGGFDESRCEQEGGDRRGEESRGSIQLRGSMILHAVSSAMFWISCNLI